MLTLCFLSEALGIAKASVKGQWVFGSKRGALLVMAQPRSSHIPPGVILKHLAKVEALKDMYLVTETYSCPAYSLYLSSGSECSCTLSIMLNIHHCKLVNVQYFVQITRSSIWH